MMGMYGGMVLFKSQDAAHPRSKHSTRSSTVLISQPCMWNNLKISNNMSNGARKRGEPPAVTPSAKSARQQNSTMHVEPPPVNTTTQNGQGGAAGGVPPPNPFGQGGAAGDTPPANPFAQGGAAGSTPPQNPFAQGGAAVGTPGGTSGGAPPANNGRFTTAGRKLCYMKKVDLTISMSEGAIPIIVARKHMA